LNEWSHIVFTWDGTSLKLYVNEIYIGSASHTKSTYRTTTQKTNIGGNIYTWGANAFFYGDIDDIRFYDCALTQEEVHQLYNVAAIFDVNNEYYTGDIKENGDATPEKWKVTPNKITYSKEFKEVDGTTKMMPDGSLHSTTFKEV
jgi:hypothetical protein